MLDKKAHGKFPNGFARSISADGDFIHEGMHADGDRNGWGRLI